MTVQQRSRGAWMAAAIGLAAAALAACGSSGSGDGQEVASLGSSQTSDDTAASDTPGDGSVDPADAEEAFLEYSQCMRDHGIEMSDPVEVDGPVAANDVGEDEGPGMVIAGPGGRISASVDPTSDEFQEAEAECSPIIEAVMGEMTIDPEREAEMREQMLAMSQCMRDHGITDFPDPTFGEGGRVQMQIGGEEGEGIDPTDPDVQAAQEACSEEIFGDASGPMIAVPAIGSEG